MLFNDNSDYFDSTSASATDAPDAASTENTDAAPGLTDGSHTEPSATDQCDNAPAPKPSHRFRNFMLWILFIVVIGAAIAFYIRYCNPYAVDAHESGIIVNVEKRGILFKTYEAEVATFASIHNHTEQYSRQKYSFANDSLAHIAQRMQQAGQPAELTYSRYFATLPWRGASVRVITGIAPAPNRQDSTYYSTY